MLDRAEAARACRMTTSLLNIYLSLAEDERSDGDIKGFNVDTAKLEAAIKAVRGARR